jgi:F-type H+-transporting ATPase subunit b
MLIDWFTVCAQAVNFLLLVWLLKRFLYKPVLAAIDAREKKIAARMTEAQAREAQARAERDEFQRRNEDFDRERAGLLRKASDEVTAERQHLMEAARQDSQALRSRLAEALSKERAELGRRLVNQTQDEMFALTRKALADLAGAGLEERMIEVFIERLSTLPAEQQQLVARFSAGPEKGTRPILIHSAFEIPAQKRAEIQAAMRTCLGVDTAARFEVLPGLVCGIELTLGGVKLAWSVTDYVTSVAQNVGVLEAEYA